MSPYTLVSLLVGAATLVGLLVKVGQKLGAIDAHLQDQDRVLEAQTAELKDQTVTLADQDTEIAVLRTRLGMLRPAALPEGDPRDDH